MKSKTRSHQCERIEPSLPVMISMNTKTRLLHILHLHMYLQRHMLTHKPSNQEPVPGGPRFARLLVLLVVLAISSGGLGLISTGCAHIGKNNKQVGTETTEQIDMDPLRVVARTGPDGVQIESYDARDLFNRASEAFTRKQFSDAVELYGILLREFPDHTLAVSARYNKGLAHEELGQVNEAAAEYRTILSGNQVTNQDEIDSCFRLVHCLEQTEHWDQIEQVLQALLDKEILNEEDRLDAMVKLGNSFREQGRLDQAEKQYHTVLNYKEQNPPKPLVRSIAYEARAQFGLAEVDRIRFEQHPLRLPQEIMETDLQDKARYFLRAQSGYFKTMAFQDTEMALAAGFRLGYIFEVFYDQLIAAPVPDDLTEEEVVVYYDELRKTIRPLVEKSVFVYQRSIALSQRWSRNNQWLKEAEERLARLRSLLDQVDRGDEATTGQQDGNGRTEKGSSSASPNASIPRSQASPMEGDETESST